MARLLIFAMKSGSWPALALLTACVLAERSANAHHAEMQSSAIAFAEPRTVVGASVDGTTFTLPPARGRFVTTTLFGAWAPSAVVAFGVRAPLHALALADGGTSAGIGDVEFTGRLRVVASEHLTISLAASLELPTGDEHKGLGAGHYGIAPSVVASFADGPWNVYGALGDAVHFEHHDEHDEGEHEHVTYVNPHSDHELVYRFGVLVEPRERFHVGGQIVGATVLAAEDRGATFAAAGPQVVLEVGGRTQLLTSWLVRVTGERRFDERASIMIQTML